MATKILERQLSDIWQKQNFQGALLTESGEKVEIVYPGRVNDSRGGDFCDAVIAFSERTVTGDVELHVRSGDWRSHGHDRDPNYNRVVLHVVHSCNVDGPTVLENGGRVPVLALGKYTSKRGRSRQAGRASGMPCSRVLNRPGERAVLAALERAGDERLLRREAAFSEELEAAEPGQVLYRGIMTALGYSKNKVPFLKLSQRLPLAELEGIGRDGRPDADFRFEVAACLVEAAGLDLADCNRHGGCRQDLDRGGLAPMQGSEWEKLRARPQNSPRARITAMSHLLARYRSQGLFRGLLGVVRDAPQERAKVHFETALLVAADGSPAGRSAQAKGRLLGRERAADIVVNVLLPFASAFGRASGQPELSRKAALLYRGWPRLGMNCLERHMSAQAGLTRGIVNSARRQQGLIEIYSRLCREGKCPECFLGQPHAGHNVQVKTVTLTTQVPEIAR